MRKVWGGAAAVLLAVSAAACSSGDAAGDGDGGGDADGLTVEVLSSRPEYVTGGDAVVAVTGEGSGTGPLGITLDGEGADDVTVEVAEEPDDAGRRIVRLDGLPEGTVTLHAEHGDRRGELAITNHPDQGPLFSGEPLELVSCTTETYGLAPSTPED